MAFAIDGTACIECGICREVCPPHAIRHRRDRTIHQYEILADRCLECEDAPCLALCPVEDAVRTSFPAERVEALRRFPPHRPEWPGTSLVATCATRAAALPELVADDAFLAAAERGALDDRHWVGAIEALWELKRWSYTVYGTWVNHTAPRRFMDLEYWISRILFDEWRELSLYTEVLIQKGFARHKRELVRKEYAKLPDFLGSAGRFVDWQEINAQFEPPIRFASLAGQRHVERAWKERLASSAPPPLAAVFRSQLPALGSHVYMAMIAIGRHHDGSAVEAKEVLFAFEQGAQAFAKALGEIGRRGLAGVTDAARPS
ncbi:MAG TPA: 4Fe-4S dicluster domain-containing protein [Candidatus Binatia bacterium]|nr:4Fe-4S dicluster domain-containing protein [Candidatus Binatia bacterium]